MKFTIGKDDLKSAAKFVGRVAPARPTSPILAGVMIHADASKGVTFTVYDYERAAQTVADATVDDGGSVLVSARLFQAITDRMPGSNVTIELDGARVRIKSGSARFDLPAMPVEEYPVPDFTAQTLATMPATVFEDAASRVAGVASKDDVTPIITAVQVTIGERVTFIATDRFRVAEYVADAAVESEGVVLIPAQVLSDAAKSFTGEVSIGVTGADNPKVVVAGNEGSIMSLMVSGNYPPVSRLMDIAVGGSTMVDSDALAETVARCSVVVEREQPLRFDFGTDALTVSSTQSENGATESLTVSDGHDQVLALKPQFVMDGLKACRSQTVEFQFSEQRSDKPGPVMFIGGNGFRYLLQPNLLMG